MNIQISFRAMDHSDSTEKYTQKALEKVKKFLGKEPSPIKIEVVLEANRVHAHHQVEIRLHSKNYHFIVKHEGADLYAEIDRVVKTLIEEIKKNKNKLLDKRKQKPEMVIPEDKDEF